MKRKPGTSKSALKRAKAKENLGAVEKPPIEPTGARRRRESVQFWEANKEKFLERFFGDDARCPSCGSDAYGPTEPEDGELPPGVLLMTKCEGCEKTESHGLNDKMFQSV